MEQRVYEVDGDWEGATLKGSVVLLKTETNVVIRDAQTNEQRNIPSFKAFFTPEDAIAAYLNHEQTILQNLEEHYKGRRKIFQEMKCRLSTISKDIENGLFEDFDYAMPIGKSDGWEEEFGVDDDYF